MTEPRLFGLDSVVVGQPRRSRWRRYAGPALAVSTRERTPLAHVTRLDDTRWLLAETSGDLVMWINRLSRWG
ncbi:hypothetical protein B6E66_08775 [Streptomyces maremycinicus]|nr:hypothetical protein B6E66_08775 [Streptomyces sp. B9173]